MDCDQSLSIASSFLWTIWPLSLTLSLSASRKKHIHISSICRKRPHMRKALHSCLLLWEPKLIYLSIYVLDDRFCFHFLLFWSISYKMYYNVNLCRVIDFVSISYYISILINLSRDACDMSTFAERIQPRHADQPTLSRWDTVWNHVRFHHLLDQWHR